MADLSGLISSVAKVSEKTSTPVYIVGGFVRDLFLKDTEDKDIDFVVSGSGLKFAKVLDAELKQLGSLVEFPDFDTARYIVGEGASQLILEFAGARSESYKSASRKPIITATNLAEDLKRRDFTVNAMALPVGSLYRGKKRLSLLVLKKNIIDPFNGQADIKDKILRTPLEPNVTFSDDPLRMLRAVRFAAELEFGLEPSTLKAIFDNHERLKIVSAERVQDELLKLLATREPSVGLALMFQTRLLDVCLPEVAALDGVEDIYGHQHKNNLIHSFKVVDNIATESPKIWLRLAGLLHDIGKPGTKKFLPKIGWSFHAHEHLGKKMVLAIAKRLRFSTDLTKYLTKLIRWHLQPIALMDKGITDSAVRRLVVTMGELLDDLLILGKGDITTGNPYKKTQRLKNYDILRAKIADLLERDKLRSFQSPFRGDEIMAAARLKPGPTVGKIKNAIEEAILEGIIQNDHDIAEEYFHKIKSSYLAEAAAWERL
ncbi:MAG: HD domain-containing protein [Candidatus Magasanikbacteria bacterium]|nr:HD domain-containing protein [Candidatus Magasanikbacteria bacterium]